MQYLAAALVFAMCLAAGLWLIHTGHYGWAWIPLLAMFGVNAKG
jgi:hypothetical protein